MTLSQIQKCTVHSFYSKIWLLKFSTILFNWNVLICSASLRNYSRIFDLHDLSMRRIWVICQRNSVVNLLARNRVSQRDQSLEGGTENTRSTRDAGETWPVSSVTFVFGDKAANCFWDRQINAGQMPNYYELLPSKKVCMSWTSWLSELYRCCDVVSL